MIYFGTDGIRGVVGEDLTQEICFRCGNAVSQLKTKAKIVIGRDTRTSGSFVLSSFVSGATMGGANVIDVGIVPTPAISFLVQHLKADFGVMITASHNPPEYNGIKIFDSTGKKICGKTETQIERNFAKQHIIKSNKFGKVLYKPKFSKLYANYLQKCTSTSLKGLNVVLDCSNGASYLIAAKVFKKLGATVTKINATNNGEKINYQCGALFPQKLAIAVKKQGADVGFAFDGDADRITIVDHNGSIIDGDQTILYLTDMFRRFGMLKSHAVVGTTQTNMAAEQYLKQQGITLIRTDVGDKFVTDELVARGLQIGGEQSGHIIVTNYCKTGDGILCALLVSKFIKLSGQKLAENIFNNLYKQHTKNYVVNDKYLVINSASTKVAIAECEQLLAGNGRVVVRASGTEPKIRVMIETQNEKLAKQIFNKIEKAIGV